MATTEELEALKTTLFAAFQVCDEADTRLASAERALEGARQRTARPASEARARRTNANILRSREVLRTAALGGRKNANTALLDALNALGAAVAESITADEKEIAKRRPPTIAA